MVTAPTVEQSKFWKHFNEELLKKFASKTKRNQYDREKIKNQFKNGRN